MAEKFYSLTEEQIPEFDTKVDQIDEFLMETPVVANNLDLSEIDLAPERDMEEIFIETDEKPMIKTVSSLEDDILEMAQYGDFVKIIENPEEAPRFIQQYSLAKEKAPELCLYEILPFKMGDNFIIEDRCPIFRGDKAINAKQISDLLNKMGLKISAEPTTRIGALVRDLINNSGVKPLDDSASEMPVEADEDVFELDSDDYLSDINNVDSDTIVIPEIDEDPFI